LAMKSIKLCNKVKNNFEAKVGETVSNPSQWTRGNAINSVCAPNFVRRNCILDPDCFIKKAYTTYGIMEMPKSEKKCKTERLALRIIP
jgi:hypothetical protein